MSTWNAPFSAWHHDTVAAVQSLMGSGLVRVLMRSGSLGVWEFWATVGCGSVAFGDNST